MRVDLLHSPASVFMYPCLFYQAVLYLTHSKTVPFSFQETFYAPGMFLNHICMLNDNIAASEL